MSMGHCNKCKDGSCFRCGFMKKFKKKTDDEKENFIFTRKMRNGIINYYLSSNFKRTGGITRDFLLNTPLYSKIHYSLRLVYSKNFNSILLNKNEQITNKWGDFYLIESIWTPIVFSIVKQDYDSFEMIISDEKTNVHENSQGHTPLWWAFQVGNIHMIKQLATKYTMDDFLLVFNEFKKWDNNNPILIEILSFLKNIIRNDLLNIGLLNDVIYSIIFPYCFTDDI